MRHLIRYFACLIAILIAGEVYAQDLAKIIKTAPNQEAFWSVSVRDAEGNELESFNSGKLIIPASNQKLYTTAAVLDALGSNFTFTTNIYGDGRQNGDVWEGSLIVRGAGDPSISGTLYDEDRYYVFKSFADQLKECGITEVDGMLLGDDRYFDGQVYPPGWDWYDMSFYYGVEISALSFNNNAVDLVVDADGKVGSVPKISWFPDNTDYVFFENEQLITPAGTEYDEYYQRDLGRNRIVLRSTLPQGYLEKESLSVFDAPLFFVNTLKKYLMSEGIVFQHVRPSVLPTGWVDRDMKLLATHTSRPLRELVAWTNKESDNFYAEMLLKTLAAEKTDTPGSFKHGVKEVRNFLGGLGIDTTYVKMNDGSGMAMGNFTTTGVFSDFLVRMQSHPEFEAFENSLSVAGIDGTLANRMKGTDLYKNMIGKSGYVGGMRTLSGYLTTSSGEILSVSLATNHFLGKVRPVDRVHEQILLYLYRKY